MIYIYGLTEPDTEEVRYIGKSIRPQQRLLNHCAERSVTYRTNWIKGLLAKGQRPGLVILETLPDGADWQEAERRWISYGREQGWRLTNCTSGGDGVPDLPPEIKARMASVWLGRKHRPETLVKIGAASRLRRHSAEWKADMSRQMQGREFTPEWRAKISKAVSKLTPEQVREIKARLAKKASQYALAREFNVHQGTISNIKRGLFYADIA